MRNLLLSCILFFSFNHLCASNKLDSLRQELDHATHDTIRIKLLIKLANEVYDVSVERSLDYLSQSIKLLEALPDKNSKQASELYMRIANVYQSIGEFDLAIKNFSIAARFSKTTKNYEDLSIALQGIGSVYQKIGEKNGDWKTARFYYNEALNTSLNIPDSKKKEEFVATLHGNIGITYAMAQQYDSAMYYYNISVKIHQQNHDTLKLASVYNNMAINYFFQDKKTECIGYLKMALAIYRKHDAKNYETITTLILNIGEVYGHLGDFTNGYQYLQQGYDIARSRKLRKNQVQALEAMSNLNEMQGNHKEALANYRMSILIRDSLLNEKRMDNINELNTLYETEKKEDEIKIQKSEISRQKTEVAAQTFQRNVFIGGTIFFLLASFFIFKGYSNKRRANILLHKQKRQIQEQNTALHQAHTDISAKNTIIEKKNKLITDSIEYAQDIQKLISPPEAQLSTLFPDAFILYRPKDIVSGDYYWFGKIDRFKCVIAADCTGHGVPGAFMSLILHNCLSMAKKDLTAVSPDSLLTLINFHLNQLFYQGIEQDPLQVKKHGCDIGIVFIDEEHQQLRFAGSRISLFIVHNHNITELKSDLQAVDGSLVNKNFSCAELKLSPDMNLYMYSDGYVDQKGGPEGKRFMSKTLKQLLHQTSGHSKQAQKKILMTEFDSWKGSKMQMDDVLIIGFQVLSLREQTEETFTNAII